MFSRNSDSEWKEQPGGTSPQSVAQAATRHVTAGRDVIFWTRDRALALVDRRSQSIDGGHGSTDLEYVIWTDRALVQYPVWCERFVNGYTCYTVGTIVWNPFSRHRYNSQPG